MAKSILMICMGNICRSPMAEGILRDMIAARGMNITTDSAGTIENHVGEAPDTRAQMCMRAHGSHIGDLRARKVTPSDFHDFDLLLAMDRSNLRNLLTLAPDEASATKAMLLMRFAPEVHRDEVPDPYYGGAEGFEDVYEMVSKACANLLDKLAADGR